MRISSLLIKLIVFISDICHLSLVKSRGVLPHIKKPRKVCAAPKGRVFVLFWPEKGSDRVWFQTELRESIEHIFRFNSKCEFEVNFKKSFLLAF